MLLVGNGRLITRDPERPYVEDGAVVLAGPLGREGGVYPELKAK